MPSFRRTPVRRAFWGLAALALVACGARGAGLVPSPATNANAIAPQTEAARSGVVLPPRDLGRRSAGAHVDVGIALRFNRETELLRLVGQIADPRSGRFRRFLTPEQFASQYAPTAQQQQRVIAALRAAGFTIEQTYPSRTLIVAGAQSADVERYFHTQIHDFDQREYGRRYANVRAATVPASIAPLVLGVEVNSLVYARPAAQRDESDGSNPAPDASGATIDAIANGGFEKGFLPWRACGTQRIYRTKYRPYAGKWDALVGSPSTKKGEINGLSAMCQAVTVPLKATLVARVLPQTNQKSEAGGYQEIGLMNASNAIVKVLHKGHIDSRVWKRVSYDLSAYAGKSLKVFFAVNGNGSSKFYDRLYVDDVSLIGTLPTPAPSPSPTPSATPTPVATATPTPVPSGGNPPLTGPKQGPAGWYPRGIADGLDYPVQNGYDGSGVTVGIVMMSKPNHTDLASFYTAAGISPAPTVTEKPVAGGPGSGDPTEVTLDVEAVSGLAPGARVVVYETPDLSNLSIEEAYGAALGVPKAAQASILESSFAECDTSDPSFDAMTDADAVQGAAIGMTFVAASGDTGAACNNGSGNVLGTYAPASDPHFIAVGGTQSLASGSVTNPVAFETSGPYQATGASGGGVSAIWTAEPSYQNGVTGLASTTARNVPDLAMPAVDDDVFVKNADQTWNGTSWAASLETALLGETVQICGPLGYANPMLYQAFATNGEGTAFLDVTSGSNSYGSITGYSAGTGYDNVSGIGMSGGIKFAAAMCGTTTSLIERGR